MSRLSPSTVSSSLPTTINGDTGQGDITIAITDNEWSLVNVVPISPNASSQSSQAGIDEPKTPEDGGIDWRVKTLTACLEEKMEEVLQLKSSLAEKTRASERLDKTLKAATAGLDLRVRSLPSRENMVGERISVAIRGRSFCFVGPRYTTVHLPDKSENSDRYFLKGKNVTGKERQFWTEDPQFQIQFCPGGVDFIHNCDNKNFKGKCWNEFKRSRHGVRDKSVISDMFDQARGREWDQACFQHMSFGQKVWHIRADKRRGPSFSDNETRKSLVNERRPDGFPEEDESMVNRIWWGHHDTFVIERADGGRCWYLGNSYPGLRDYIRFGIKGCKTIKALALDPENDHAWVIIFTNGEVAYSRHPKSSTVHFDHFEFEEFATKNFGCDFGLLEDPLGVDPSVTTPGSSAPCSIPVEEDSDEDSDEDMGF